MLKIMRHFILDSWRCYKQVCIVCACVRVSKNKSDGCF